MATPSSSEVTVESSAVQPLPSLITNVPADPAARQLLALAQEIADRPSLVPASCEITLEPSYSLIVPFSHQPAVVGVTAGGPSNSSMVPDSTRGPVPVGEGRKNATRTSGGAVVGISAGHDFELLGGTGRLRSPAASVIEQHRPALPDGPTVIPGIARDTEQALGRP